ncbi:hypothetical protein DFH29DRAFT_1076483 [Suillus ampliporus]|nr:hypothetical protein DFH29DRAFT_1076483 [Suillus ampliporus]
MLRDASDIFLTQISSRKFIDTLEDVLTSSRTSPVVRERPMEVLAAAAFLTSSRPDPSSKFEPSPFSLKDRDRDRDSFRALWTRLKPADKPDVGIPFDTEDAMFSPPIVPTRPPIGERPSRKSLHQRDVIPPNHTMELLFLSSCLPSLMFNSFSPSLSLCLISCSAILQQQNNVGRRTPPMLPQAAHGLPRPLSPINHLRNRTLLSRHHPPHLLPLELLCQHLLALM